MSPLNRLPDDASRKKPRRMFRGVILIAVGLFVFATFRRTALSSNYDYLITRTATTTSSAESVIGSVYDKRSVIIYDKRSSPVVYRPAPVEAYIMNHTVPLGWHLKPPAHRVPTCKLWKDPNSSPYYQQLHTYVREVSTYYQKLDQFHLPAGITDVRNHKLHPNDNQICQSVELHPDGLMGMFQQSGQLSYTQAGYVEPLLPPMRHPGLCLEENVGVARHKINVLMSLRYILHDWAHLCRSLKPTSRTVFVDMGASLQFHGNNPSPALELLEQYRRMGIPFDHIYAYEANVANPAAVFQALPKHLRASFHWINVPVNAEPNHMHNPWNILLDNFREDDLIVVKLDIDTPAIEHPLAHQLLNTPRLQKLVDHFYFEHHVNQQELAGHWEGTTESVEQSFQLMHGLRQKGVAAHFWV